MRFIFVDRIVALEPGHSIEVVKNVSASEDVFDDHFPGCPIFPGALVVEVFEQAAQLLIAITHAFASVGRLQAVRRASFRHFVGPGDQLRARCDLGPLADTHYRITARGEVDDRRVATALLDFSLEVAEATGEGRERSERLREMARVLREHPLALARLQS